MVILGTGIFWEGTLIREVIIYIYKWIYHIEFSYLTSKHTTLSVYGLDIKNITLNVLILILSVYGLDIKKYSKCFINPAYG